MGKQYREGKLQSNNDNEQANQLAEYIQSSQTIPVYKMADFTKYVQKNEISRFIARYEIFKMQLEVPGSIIELGVLRGASLMTWAQLSTITEPTNFTREIVGFDTLEGIPFVHDKDKNNWSTLLSPGQMNSGAGMEQDLRRAIEIYDLNRPLGHIEKVKLIKGNIMETLPKYIQDNPHLSVSLLHMDTDLYEPTKLALELLLPRMTKGAVLLFDEFNAKTYPGETIAILDSIGIRSIRLKRFPWATTVAYAVLE